MVATSQIGRKLARKRALKTFEEAIVRPRLTGAQAAAQIVKSGAFGAWKDRTDITNSSEYARELRRQAETRDTLPVMEPTADVVTKRSGGVTVYSSTSGKTGTKLGGGEQTITRTESSIPGVLTGGHAVDGSGAPDTRGIVEQVVDNNTGERSEQWEHR